jgi:HK97 family phage major capsid protein
MSVDAFETWIVNTMTKKMIKAIEAAIVSGNGSQRPTGIIPGTTWNESNSISYTDTASVTNQFDYDDFIDAESKIDEDYAGAAVYVMNAKTLATVRKLKDDNKRPLFERAVEDGFRGTLNGIPVKLSRNVPDDTILLGDFESGYVLNFTSPIEYSSSKEAGFMSGATIYRGLALLDGKPTGVAGAIVKMAITRYSAE